MPVIGRSTAILWLLLVLAFTASGAPTYFWELDVDVRIINNSLGSRGYVVAYDPVSLVQVSGAIADIHHTIVGTDASYSARSAAPYSKLIQSSHPGYPGFCYTGRLAVYPQDGSQHHDASEQLCFYGPPDPPPPPPDVDDPGGCGYCDSPIIIALDDVYRLTSFANGVQFDLRNEGIPAQVAWTQAAAENAFLALDRDGNGRIDNGSELFGNFTRLRSGGLAPNGFEALAELDEDGNGAINASDAVWLTLLLWTDRDHDGNSSSSELQSIALSPIEAIETDYRVAGRRDQWGNRFRYQSHLRLTHGGRRTFYDVFLLTR